MSLRRSQWKTIELTQTHIIDSNSDIRSSYQKFACISKYIFQHGHAHSSVLICTRKFIYIDVKVSANESRSFVHTYYFALKYFLFNLNHTIFDSYPLRLNSVKFWSILRHAYNRSSFGYLTLRKQYLNSEFPRNNVELSTKDEVSFYL